MTAAELKKVLSKLRSDDMDYLITNTDGNLMTVRFYIKGNKQ
tara:strand:+ start:1387 stop:1512 length:126 start_codon:yes stop_codon:yes gene_type:complete